MHYPIQSRPEITLVGGKILRNGEPCRVTISKDRIRIGCSDIAPEAAGWIYEIWQREFSGTHAEVVIQP